MLYIVLLMWYTMYIKRKGEDKVYFKYMSKEEIERCKTGICPFCKKETLKIKLETLESFVLEEYAYCPECGYYYEELYGSIREHGIYKDNKMVRELSCEELVKNAIEILGLEEFLKKEREV